MNCSNYINKIVFTAIICILTINISANAKETTVHKWEYQINRACSQYVSTNYTPWDLYNCLIETTRDGFYWQQGWEKPVKADVIMPLTMFQPEVLNLSVGEKQDVAAGYQQTLPKMYLKKLNERKNAHVKFTQQDVNRIWGR